jgi:hypothetical protein
MKIAYGISIPGFIMTCTLWVHLAAKTVSQVHGESPCHFADGVYLSCSSVYFATLSICRTTVLFTGLYGCTCIRRAPSLKLC